MRSPWLPHISFVLLALAAPALAAESHVIPPGQESVVNAMLDIKTPPPDACALTNAQLAANAIRAEFHCGTEVVKVVLANRQDEPTVPEQTAQFALKLEGKAPAVLRAALLTSIKAHEAEFKWLAIAEQPKRPPLRGEQPTDMTASQWAAMQKGEALYVEKKNQEAFEVFVGLARETTATGVLGMVVATLATTVTSQERVDGFRKDADASPQDPLKQFLAGVALHYYGHRRAQSRDEKRQYYTAAIPYLERARTAYPKEARVYIYLAVSHFRLGHQQAAEAAIEQAVQVGERDADAYYCHAEVYQRVNLPQAIEDVKKYLAVTEKVAKEAPGFVNHDKQVRVQEMLKHLLAFQAGTEKPEDLFDPLPDEVTHVSSDGDKRGWLGPASLGAVLGMLAAGVWLWRRKRKAAK